MPRRPRRPVKLLVLDLRAEHRRLCHGRRAAPYCPLPHIQILHQLGTLFRPRRVAVGVPQRDPLLMATLEERAGAGGREAELRELLAEGLVFEHRVGESGEAFGGVGGRGPGGGGCDAEGGRGGRGAGGGGREAEGGGGGGGRGLGFGRLWGAGAGLVDVLVNLPGLHAGPAYGAGDEAVVWGEGQHSWCVRGGIRGAYLAGRVPPQWGPRYRGPPLPAPWRR